MIAKDLIKHQSEVVRTSVKLLLLNQIIFSRTHVEVEHDKIDTTISFRLQGKVKRSSLFVLFNYPVKDFFFSPEIGGLGYVLTITL